MIALVALAWAHRPGLSYARIDDAALTLTFARPELAAFGPMEDLDVARVLLAEATVAKVRLTPCTLGESTVRAVEGDGVELRAPIDCDGGERIYDAGFLASFEPGHRHYVETSAGPVAVLDAGHASTAVGAGTDRWAVGVRFARLGVEHIWTGYDHLLFLVGLLLAAQSLRSMLLIVTGFTVAHSITLSLAALELVSIPAAFVEPAIAATILYVGLENFWSPSARRRAILTFVLGLVHGFGFAGLLIELGLPRGALAVALGSFNLGVEAGQAAVVALTMPLLLWLRRWPWWTGWGVRVGSAGVALAGAGWLVSRVV